MAIQLHVSFSSVFEGLGIVAGSPYHCANGQMQTALTTCMNNYGIFGGVNVANLQNKAASNENAGLIDKLDNLKNDKLYIFAGMNDMVVRKGNYINK